MEKAGPIQTRNKPVGNHLHQDYLFRIVRPFLFKQDPEKVHEQTLWTIRQVYKFSGIPWLMQNIYGFEHPALKTELWGKSFPNPIGMAAGFDKNGMVFNPLFSLGFGFVEIGTVTPLPQPGNPRPRLFRCEEEQALINRLGFNNQGVQALLKNLQGTPPRGILGINIGKNKETPLKDAHVDYESVLRSAYELTDYVVINVSSPNTERLRTLQEQESLFRLMSKVLQTRKELVKWGKARIPVLLKIAPDLTDEIFRDIVSVVEVLDIDGIVATNTTLTRNNANHARVVGEAGGLSGIPLQELSTQVISRFYRHFGKSMPIIGVGGVFTGKDAYEKIRAGASLIQVYTGMVYRGPATVKYIKQELLRLLDQDGFSSVRQAVGADFN